MPSDKFYTSKRWRRTRARVLRRDDYQCTECRKYGRIIEAVTVHHIMERSHFPELAYAQKNLQSLCLACHNKQHPEKGGHRY